MSNENKDEGAQSSEAPKILTPKELLEKRKQFLAQTKPHQGSGRNTGSGSKGSSGHAAGHKPRVHRPQGG